ncbi:MAG: M14 family zinc carboxypeptidase [Cellulomonas sp.]
MTSTVVGAHLNALAVGNPTVCTRSGPADWGPDRVGPSSGYVKIAATAPGSPTSRWGVLLTGGMHARELAPPDALVSFLEKLVAAYAAKASITYPSWTDPVSGIIYDTFTIPWPWVRKVVESLDLYVVPLVNDDGRDFVLAPLPPGSSLSDHTLHKKWRKNRRPAPSGYSSPWAVGVDLNRNFDVLWDFGKAYDTSIADVHSSSDPRSETFIGPAADGPEAEPETKNVAGLMRSKDISFFLDVHAYSRDVLFSWGIEANQSTDVSMNFENPAWDGKRDGTRNTSYQEYIPTDVDHASQAMAQRISDLVFTKAGGSDARAQARSRYTVMSAADLYVTSGSSQDYAFSRWFTAAAHGSPIRPVMSFTIEVGGDPKKGSDFDEGGFTPDYVKQFPKLEREIHVAAWAFLTAVAATNMQPASTPPPPAPTPTSNCFVAGAAYGDSMHPDVLLLRDIRDRQLRTLSSGRMFATGLVNLYGRVGPGLATRVGPHPRARSVVRGGLLRPFVHMLRLASTVLRRWPRVRAAALTLLFVIAAPVLGTGLALTDLVVRVLDRRENREPRR